MFKDSVLITEAALKQLVRHQKPDPTPSAKAMFAETRRDLSLQHDQRIGSPVEIDGARVFEYAGRFWVARFRGLAPLDTELGPEVETDLD